MALINIFIIDDDPQNIKNYSKHIKIDKGFNLRSNTDSKTAYRLITSKVVDLPEIIITDWDMPKMNGIELIKMLKQNPLTAQIPIIMATGIHKEDKHLEEALNAGARDFLRKPINPVELIARIKSVHSAYLSYKRNIERNKREMLGNQVLLDKQQQLLTEIQGKLSQGNHKAAIQIIEDHTSKFESEVKNFLDGYREINPIFFDAIDKKASEVGANVTDQNKKFLSYMALGMGNQDLAAFLEVTDQAVIRSKSRIREKLGLANNEQLAQFIRDNT